MGDIMMAYVLLALTTFFPLLASGDAFGSVCPSWEDNPWCPCYSNVDGINMECPMVSLNTIADVLGLVNEPVKSLSIYDLEMNVTTLPSGIFRQSAGVSNLQISHSNIMSLADNSLHGLERSLESLTIKHCKLSTIPQIALHKLTQLSTLDLQTNNITELPSFGFAKMNIKDLNFKGNMISLVSDYAFDGLENTLEALNLMNNDLRALPVKSLEILNNLKKLEVAWNHIDEIVTGNAHLKAIEHLDISSNEIKRIRSNSLIGMPQLVYLSLYMNSISTIAKDAFKENSNLQTLFLGHNEIRELDPRTFKHTPKLSVIDLGNNNIHSINEGLFSNLPDLKELVLFSNNIREIMKDTFENSSSIRVLNLEKNAIRLIEAESFIEMRGLETLLLSHNNIQEISTRLFAYNTYLKVLKLDHNGITDLDEFTFKNTTSLQKLCLQKNKINKISQGLFTRLLDLRELHLHENNIGAIPSEVFSNLRKLEYLSLQENRIFTLLDTLNHQSKTLYHLRLSGNEITSVHPKAFTGQNQLDILWLDHNNITVITTEVFSDLSELRQLHLQYNKITDIADEAFSNMKNLQKLYLSNNNLVKINENTFKGLSLVRDLYINGNNIKEISPNAFQWATELQRLELSGNTLSLLKKDHFGTELSIRELSINNAQMNKIEDGALEALMYLESLSLSGNNLNELHEGFLRLTQLHTLDLSKNSFKTLNINSLTALPNLENLDLSNCEIDTIPDNFFDSSISLKSLNMAGNNIKYINPAALFGLNDLTSLDVSENELTIDSCKSFLITEKVETLSISGNPMISLCSGLGQLRGLTELHASGIDMITVELDTFNELRYLSHLDVSDNYIVDFPLGTFQKSSLKQLNLAGNLLTQIPDALFIDEMEKLKALNVSNNPLHRLVGSSVTKSKSLRSLENLDASRTNLTVITSLEFTHMPALRSLNLEGGAIAKVSPGAFRSLSQLSQLNLAYNRLEIMPRERLRGLISLSHLNLTRNRMKKLDQLPSDAQNLKVLDVSGNMFTEMEETTFKHAHGLEELLLSDNWITSIHPKALESLTHLKVMDLSQNNLELLQPSVFQAIERTLGSYRIDGNPVTCGCETLEFWTWLQNHPGQVKHPNSIYCDFPKRLRGQSFLQLPAPAFCSQPLILRLAIQDIQSESLLVSWQAANSSSVYGFKVTYQVVGQATDGSEEGFENRLTVQSSPTLGLSSRTYLLEDLQPGTEYQVCVHGLTKSIGLARSHTVAHEYNKQQEEGARCSRSQTLSIAAAPATGTSGGRIGIILGIIMAVALLLGVIVAVVWYCTCRSHNRHGQQAMKQSNGGPPDYYSHYEGRHPGHRDDDEFAC